MHFNNDAQFSPSALNQPSRSGKRGNLEALNVNKQPIRLQSLCRTVLIQGHNRHRDLRYLPAQSLVGCTEPAHSFSISSVKDLLTVSLANRGRHDLYLADQSVHRDVLLEDQTRAWVRLEGYHLSGGTRPVGELQDINSDVSSHVKAHRTRLDVLAQKGCYWCVVVLCESMPLMRIDAVSDAVNIPGDTSSIA